MQMTSSPTVHKSNLFIFCVKCICVRLISIGRTSYIHTEHWTRKRCVCVRYTRGAARCGECLSLGSSVFSFVFIVPCMYTVSVSLFPFSCHSGFESIDVEEIPRRMCAVRVLFLWLFAFAFRLHESVSLCVAFILRLFPFTADDYTIRYDHRHRPCKPNNKWNKLNRTKTIWRLIIFAFASVVRLSLSLPLIGLFEWLLVCYVRKARVSAFWLVTFVDNTARRYKCFSLFVSHPSSHRVHRNSCFRQFFVVFK